MIGEILIGIGVILGTAYAFGKFAAFRFIVYLGGILVILGLFYKLFIKKYDEYQRGIIFRMGKFSRVAGPGWTVVIPFFEKEFQRVDIRVKTINLFVPVAFTEDDLRLKIDGTVYYKISDPNKALLKIDNYMTGLLDLIKSETRNLIASMNMRALFSKLDIFNDLLADRISHEAWKWGIEISMVQIKGIMPPEEISVAMQSKEIAEQYLQAERFKAEAQKIVIEALGDGAKRLDDKAVMYLYVKALEEMSKGSATKIVLPMQMGGIIDSIGQGLGLGTGLDVNSAIKNVKDAIAKG